MIDTNRKVHYLFQMSTYFKFIFLASALTPANMIAYLMLSHAGKDLISYIFIALFLFGIFSSIWIAINFLRMHAGNSLRIVNLENREDDVLSYILIFVPVFISSNVDSWQTSTALFIFYFTAISLLFNSNRMIPNPVLAFFGWTYYLATIEENNKTKKRLVVVKPDDKIETGENSLIPISSWGIYIYESGNKSI